MGVALAEAGALGGVHDLQVHLQMRDGAVPWAQWVQVRLPLATSAGLAPSSRLRLRVRSNGPRLMRINVDSSAYSDRDTSGDLGWDVELDGTSQLLELDFADATFWGEAGVDSPADILAETTALLLEPAAAGRDGDGWLGAGVVDSGELHVDDIELLP